MSAMVSGPAQASGVVVVAAAASGVGLHPVRWSESISVPSTVPFNRSTSVCRQYVDGKRWTSSSSSDDGPSSATVDVRCCDGVRFESRLSKLRPVGYTESIICYVGNGGVGHHRLTAEYAAGPPAALLRASSFFETCYILPLDSRKSQVAAFGEAVESNSRSQAAGRWYSASLQLLPNAASAADMNNNGNVGRRSVAGPRRGRSSTSSTSEAAPASPSSFRTRLVVESTSTYS